MNNFTFVKRIFLLIFTTVALGSLQAQEAGLLVVSNTACPGNTIDVEVKAMNWEQVTSMQFTLGWDADILEYIDINTFGSPITDINFGTTIANEGFIGASWLDLSTNGVTIHNEVIFTVSFNVIGDAGESTLLEFFDWPTDIEFSKDVDGTAEVFTPNLVGGTVSLDGPGLSSIIGENEMNGNGQGSLSMVVTGGTAPYSFLWSNNMTTSNIFGLSAGDFSCVVTDALGCSIELGLFSIINDTSNSINSIEGLNAFTLTPNPAADFVNLNVDFDQTEETSIKIYSLTGKEVYQRTVNAQTFDLQIPLSDFANGAYFIELTTSTGKAVEKLIIAE